MNADTHNCNGRRTADVLLRFNRPTQPFLHRAYDHLIAARLGMTLMVPVGATAGRLVPMRDQCPVSWLEVQAILDAEYAGAADLSIVALVQDAVSITRPTSPLGTFARAVLDSFIGSDQDAAIALTDKDWRHAKIYLTKGGEASRVFIGAAGVRFAFTPDFLDGVL